MSNTKKGKRMKESEKESKSKTKSNNKKNREIKKEDVNTRKKDKKKMSTGKKIFLAILLIIIIAAGVFAYKTYKNGGGVSGALATAMGHDEETKKNLPEFKVLILGISTDLDSDLTDTIMVASYNPNTQKASILSIQRDTFTGKNKNKATGSDKINALYNLTGGPEGTLEAVNELTGLNIEHYVVVKTEALIQLVDAIGGVTFNVPIDMKYDDKTQNLHINLKAGEQVVDGEKAEQLLRFRHNNDGTTYPVEYGDNDIGRMRTQREFISAVLRQTLSVENIFKINQILDIAKENVITNIDFNTAKDYVPYAVEFNTENLVTDTLPGTSELCNGVWIYIIDKTQAKVVLNTLFGTDEETEENTNTTNNTSANSTNTTSSSTVKTKENLKIELANASGNAELLEQVAVKLEAAGFTITKKSTEDNASSRTVIENRKYIDEELVNELKTALNAGEISNSANSTSQVDIKITIGTNYSL